MSENNKVKLSEKLSHYFRKKWLVSGIQFVLIIAILFVSYYCLYLAMNYHELPSLDVTENKIHTLSDASKNVMSQIENDVEIYAFGFPKQASIFNLLEQYHKANEKITYRTITKEDDYTIVNKYNLMDDYHVLIIKSGESEKLVDNSEFETLDYTINQYIDITEQVITNSILSLVEENKPVVYFTEGHNEYTDDDLYTIQYFLSNEAFTVKRVNLFTAQEMPEDCDILAIMAPTSDFYESEVDLIKNYISKGGNLYISLEILQNDKEYKNLQTILDEYGVTFENGIIWEKEAEKYNTKYPFVFMPEISSESQITKDIYTDNVITLVESARIKVDEDKMSELNVEKEDLLNSSENSLFINDLTNPSLEDAVGKADVGESLIAASFEKKIDDNSTSKLVVSASSSFMTDILSSYVSDSYPLSYIGSNKDFVINAMSYLGDKDYVLTIRKDYAANTYTPTNTQNRVVLTIIFAVPIFIIFAGIIIWNFRRKKK